MSLRRHAAWIAVAWPLADFEAEWEDGMFSSERWIQVIYGAI